MEERERGRLLGLVALGVVLGLAILILLFWRDILELKRYGYFGGFLISLLGSATVIIPVPALAVVFILGGILQYPLLLGLVVGIAEPIGELTGYLGGRGGRAALGHNPHPMVSRLERWMTRRGGVVVLGLSSFPNPFFDLVGVVAGGLHYPIWKFLLFCWAGKTIKGITVAMAGAWGLKFIQRWLELPLF